jgi:hypothetical protein
MTSVVLSSEYPDDLIGLPGRAPLLCWKVSDSAADSIEVSAQIKVVAETSRTFNSGRYTFKLTHLQIAH